MSLSQFFTNKEWSDKIVKWANITTGMSVLEPSAGIGSLVVPLLDMGAYVTAIEIDEYLLPPKRLSDSSKAFWMYTDFLSMAPKQTYNVVVMNPPFEKNQHVTHISHALKFSNRVVSLAPLSILSSRERHKQLWCRNDIYLSRLGILVGRPKCDNSEYGPMHDYCLIELQYTNNLNLKTEVGWV